MKYGISVKLLNYKDIGEVGRVKHFVRNKDFKRNKIENKNLYLCNYALSLSKYVSFIEMYLRASFA